MGCDQDSIAHISLVRMVVSSKITEFLNIYHVHIRLIKQGN